MDNLDIMMQGTETAPTPTANPAPTSVATTAQQTTALSNDFSLSYDDADIAELEAMGIVVADMGKKVSRVPIEKYKASANRVDRIAFIQSRIMGIKMHYIDNIGSIICYGGKCCDIAGSPQVRYLFPILVYQTDDEGRVTGKKVEIKVLSAGEDLYKVIMTNARAAEEFGGIDHVDMFVTCTDEKFQKISLSLAGAAAWRKAAPIMEFVAEKWKNDGKYAYQAVARKMDEPTLLKLLGEATPTQETLSQVSDAADLSKFFGDN